MNVDDAIDRACAEVGIVPPRVHKEGRWTRTNTLDGKRGRGDGSLMVKEHCVTAFNWQTGDNKTVFLNGGETISPERKRRFAEARTRRRHEERENARRAAQIANDLTTATRQGEHPYLVEKGFRERTLIVDRAAVERIGGKYLVPDHGSSAVVLPARVGPAITSAQLIWETGEKRFIFGGRMGGARHRICSGADTWLCEGFATGLSLRAALRGLRISATILVCFSASNIVAVASTISGRCFVAADRDAPPRHKPEQFDGLGAGEYFARKAGKPYLMPPNVGDDINDFHKREGIFEVQRLISQFLRSGVRP